MFERPPTVGVMKDIIGCEINGRTKSQFFFSFVVPCLSEKHVAECCGDNSVSLMCHDSFVGIVLCHMIFCEGPFPFWTYLQSHLWSRLLEILAGHSEFGSAYFENQYMKRRGRNTKRVVIPTLCQHLNSISEKLMTSGSMYVKNGCPNIVNANTTLFFFCERPFIMSMSSEHAFDRFVFRGFRTMILSRGNDSGADHAILQKSARRNTDPWSSEHNLPSTPMSCDSIFCPSHDLVCV